MSIHALRPPFLFLRAACCLLLALCGGARAHAAPLEIVLRDALNGLPLAAQKVGVYAKSANGELTWLRGGTTDAQGRVAIEVTGAPSSALVVRTRPFAMWIERPVPAGGTLEIAAGTLRVRVVHGVTGAALPNVPIALGTRGADGAFHGVANATADAAGALRLDPPAAAGASYQLRGDSPIDGSRKYSPPLPAAGDFVFRLGNRAVTLEITDWSSGAPLGGERVEIRERLGDGSLVWVGARDSDDAGRVTLDLDGLNDGRRYLARVKPYLQWIEREITAAGRIAVRAGRVPATILDGDSGAPLAQREIVLVTRAAPDAPWQYEFKATSDAGGRLVFDPQRLGAQQYALRAASPIDGSVKYSAPFGAPGPVTFAVGNRRLTVAVAAARDGAPLAGLAVSAREIHADGTLGPALTRSTDAAGRAHFDLDGLGRGVRYRLRTQPYLLPIERDVEDPGWVEIAAGALRVQVENGANGRPLGRYAVRLHELRPDGTRVGLRTLTTAADGSLVLDPPALGAKRYQLSAVSPFDGSTKFSPALDAGGEAVFSVGGAGATVRLRDWQSGAPLIGQTVSVYARGADGGLTWAAARSTDADGRARFDLDGLADGRRYVVRAKPYLQWIEREIAAPGPLDLRAGTLRVDVRRGDTGAAYAAAAVKLLSVDADGAYAGVASFTTPASGELVLDPPELGTRRYVLRAASPADGSSKYSATFARPGAVRFTVGNPPLRMRLVDQQLRTPLPGAPLQIYALAADGSRSWVTGGTTDAFGLAVFDLDGFAQGRRYVLRARPFAQWLERIVTSAEPLVIQAGSATVQLVDGDGNAPLADVEVRAHVKSADGSLGPALGRGATDARGRIRFDPPELGAGGVAVYAAVDPYGDGVTHYSAPSVAPGLFHFELRRGAPRRLDRKPAELDVTLPRVNQRISSAGVALSGHARDETELRGVTVEVLNGTASLGRYAAEIDRATQRWSVVTSALPVDPGARLTLRIVATDGDYNATTTEFKVTAIADTTPPTVTVRSPGAGAVSDGRGLLVLGTVRDDTQWDRVALRLEDDGKAPVGYRDVEVDPATGDWAYAIPADALRGRSAVTIRARAVDRAGNVADVAREVRIDPQGDPLRHLLARITYGETPALYAEARRVGFSTFLERQLAPENIDDGALEARLTTLPVTNAGELRREILLRASASERQLNEVMTAFWDNHFNTDYARHGRFEHERADNAAFRRHALGRFRDLLGASAHSYAMLVYLDNAHSHKRRPNENYARELLELHTMGSGYTQRDINEIARAFTGWSIADNAYAFLPERHDDDAKTVLGHVLPAGGGAEDGEQVLDLLAARPETAQHLCTKLARRFVSEAPAPALVTRCANVFRAQRAAPDQIARVLRTLLTAPEFRAAENRGAKVKDSLRFALGAVRATEALRSGNDLARIVEDLSQPLLLAPTPDGYPDDSASWTGPYLLRARLQFVGRLIENSPRGAQVGANPRALLHGVPEVRTTEGVAARVLQNLNAGAFDAAELALAVAALTADGTRTFTLDAPHADAALARLARTALSLPRYQLY